MGKHLLDVSPIVLRQWQAGRGRAADLGQAFTGSFC
jgi:hypothetical protein